MSMCEQAIGVVNCMYMYRITKIIFAKTTFFAHSPKFCPTNFTRYKVAHQLVLKSLPADWSLHNSQKMQEKKTRELDYTKVTTGERVKTLFLKNLLATK